MTNEPPREDVGFFRDIAMTFFGAFSGALLRFLTATVVGALVGGAIGFFIAGSPTALLGAGIGAAAAFLATMAFS
ncbi:hypothetical protein Poly30_13050 [Planctomycetes bacterium Poly30]|uniref:Uncharacterized protein n=1 Tax=Saltatorellus ferox TaxID=2528018 RepID=A0A518ENZ6_9BACT|nr:hypothetical protein Poly30_13050 [Planctomycetes bacterium Poly30]